MSVRLSLKKAVTMPIQKCPSRLTSSRRHRRKYKV